MSALGSRPLSRAAANSVAAAKRAREAIAPDQYSDRPSMLADFLTNPALLPRKPPTPNFPRREP